MYNWFILKDYEASSVRGQGGRGLEDADETQLWDLDSEEQKKAILMFFKCFQNKNV